MTIRLLVNGLPGRMALEVAGHALDDARFELLPVSLTGPGVAAREVVLGTTRIELVAPERHAEALDRLAGQAGLLAVDYTHPDAALPNARAYAARGIPFVMGTTGGDVRAIAAAVEGGRVPAVVAPNMAAPVVALQAAFAYLAENFPGILEGYSLSVTESHQAGKADTSGTAKAMVAHFAALGCDFSVERIAKVRDPQAQRAMGVPEAHLAGHAYHTYRLASPERSVDVALSHDIRGRAVYAAGTLLAARFLAKKIAAGGPPRVYSMIDVMRG